MKQIGPSFGKDLAEAGLGDLPLSWGSDGKIEFGKDVTPEQQAAVMAVYTAHDPAEVVADPLPTKQELLDEIEALRRKVEKLP